MSVNKEEHQQYFNDPRIACKYGVKCYQKNPVHQKKYKHPPGQKVNVKHIAKKFKADEQNNVKTIPKVEDSDDETENSSHFSDCKMQESNVSNAVSESDSDNESIETVTIQKTVEIKQMENVKHSNLCEHDLDNDDLFKNLNESDIDSVVKYKDFIKEFFLINMPTNFFNFWNFCKKVKRNNPQEALKEVGLTLVGPYDVLAGKFINVAKSPGEFLVHWRYFRDPPEFQTVLKGNEKSGYHIGYFRDSPDEVPMFLCSNQSKKDGVFTPMGGNIFAAVNFYLEDLKKTGSPFEKMSIGSIQALLTREASALGMDMSRKTNAMVVREKKIVTRSFNKIGLVVPFDKKTEVGYRELALNNKDLNILLTKLQSSKSNEEKSKYLSEIQPVFTFANIATDECDFGTGIELGWNVLAHGIDSLNLTIKNFFVTNYRLLNREAFAKIAEAHMENRREGSNLSIL